MIIFHLILRKLTIYLNISSTNYGNYLGQCEFVAFNTQVFKFEVELLCNPQNDLTIVFYLLLRKLVELWKHTFNSRHINSISPCKLALLRQVIILCSPSLFCPIILPLLCIFITEKIGRISIEIMRIFKSILHVLCPRNEREQMFNILMMFIAFEFLLLSLSDIFSQYWRGGVISGSALIDLLQSFLMRCLLFQQKEPTPHTPIIVTGKCHKFKTQVLLQRIVINSKLGQPSFFQTYQLSKTQSQRYDQFSNILNLPSGLTASIFIYFKLIQQTHQSNIPTQFKQLEGGPVISGCILITKKHANEKKKNLKKNYNFMFSQVIPNKQSLQKLKFIYPSNSIKQQQNSFMIMIFKGDFKKYNVVLFYENLIIFVIHFMPLWDMPLRWVIFGLRTAKCVGQLSISFFFSDREFLTKFQAICCINIFQQSPMFCFVTPFVSNNLALFSCLTTQPNLLFLPSEQTSNYGPSTSIMPQTHLEIQTLGHLPSMLCFQHTLPLAKSVWDQQADLNTPCKNKIIQPDNLMPLTFIPQIPPQDELDSTSKEEAPKMSKKTHRNIEKKRSETKNLIKNYGRAILTFILKNSSLRVKVVQHLGIADSEFLKEVYAYRNHIHTISAIRYLWQNHPFCQAFRILSCEYLRKHNLEHIFNSRVFKHSIYLKYQQKLMRSMQRPQEFESIKQI